MPPLPYPGDAARRQIRHYQRSRAWCEWAEFDTWAPLIGAALADPDGAAWPPFQLLSLPGISGAQQRACAVRWMAQRLDTSAPARAHAARRFRQPRPRAPGQRLRIGYLSADFHEHATALLMVEALEAHDRRHFELHAYSHGRADSGAMRQRLALAFDAFHDIGAQDDAGAADRIYADGIDILVDLGGYTAGSRTLLLAWRPAPIQVSYLGYPGTLGDTVADYLIADRFVAPAHAAAQFSEALAYLPGSYQPHAAHRPSAVTPSRAEAGLPNDGVVFCCFNQAWKFTPAVFDVWCRLLAQTPGSVLWLLQDDCAEGNLRQEALARGVSPHRLVFAPQQGQAAHLARLALADLVLDTWPYNAHTTASDALGAGVPLVTLAGDTFAARVAGSLLHAVGLPGLVTHTVADYTALALQLAQNAPQRQALRATLARLAPQASLFDVPAYTRGLESLYQAMWARHAAGLAPGTLAA